MDKLQYRIIVRHRIESVLHKYFHLDQQEVQQHHFVVGIDCTTKQKQEQTMYYFQILLVFYSILMNLLTTQECKHHVYHAWIQ